MSYQIKYLEEVRIDIEDAYNWYESRRSGLGDEFVLAVEHLTERISQGPRSFPQEDGRHKAVLSRFPFNIYFELHDPEVIVVAVFHTSQHPDGWKNR